MAHVSKAWAPLCFGLCLHLGWPVLPGFRRRFRFFNLVIHLPPFLYEWCYEPPGHSTGYDYDQHQAQDHLSARR